MKFKQLDPDAFERYFSGIGRPAAIELYAKLCGLFSKSLETKLGNLRKSLETNDNALAIVISHQLKGSLLSLGGNELSKGFKRIELEANLTPNSVLLELLASKTSELNEFLVELQAYVEELKSTRNE